jgi:hypothetical protein
MGELFMNTFDSLLTIKEIFNKDEIYEGLNTITKEQYKQYLIKVKGIKIED